MLILALAIALPILYVFIGAAWGAYLYKLWGETCSHRYCEHEIGCVFSGIFWPISLLSIGGVMFGRSIKTPNERAEEQKVIENENRKRLEALEEENRRLDRAIKSSDWYESEIEKIQSVPIKIVDGNC